LLSLLLSTFVTHFLDEQLSALFPAFGCRSLPGDREWVKAPGR
jgi:hypothetical protein